MIIALYIVAAVIMAVGSLYLAWQNREFRKFLAGAFFVSSGILFYLYLADVSVPLLGQILSKHRRLAVAAPSSISSSFRSVSILASSGSPRFEPGKSGHCPNTVLRPIRPSDRQMF